MPELNRSSHIHPAKRAEAFTASRAANSSMLVEITCALCNIKRNYLASDILKLCGDVMSDEIAPQFRCERCGQQEYLDAKFRSSRGNDIGKLPVRRLVKIKMVRKPIWQDGFL